MTLKTWIRVGPYEILAAIGAGGMGEVYRARDTKPGRDVALKTLPDAFRSNEDRLARWILPISGDHKPRPYRNAPVNESAGRISPDGRELYFVAEDRAMAVSVQTSNGAPELSPPSRVFSDKSLGSDIYGSPATQPAWFAPSPDGQRFLVLVPVDSDRPATLHLIHNWKP